MSFYVPTTLLRLLSSTRATNEGIAVLEVWSIYSFAIRRILGIKRIFPCSFENKRMHLLTRVYGIISITIGRCFSIMGRVWASST